MFDEGVAVLVTLVFAVDSPELLSDLLALGLRCFGGEGLLRFSCRLLPYDICGFDA